MSLCSIWIRPSSHDNFITVAGTNFDPTNKKRAAPLEWNFVSEQNYTQERQSQNAQAPGIGPAIPGVAETNKQKQPERARFVPLDIDPLVTTLSFWKVPFNSKIFQKIQINSGKRPKPYWVSSPATSATCAPNRLLKTNLPGLPIYNRNRILKSWIRGWEREILVKWFLRNKINSLKFFK